MLAEDVFGLDVLYEGTNMPLIIVDVQPAYNRWCGSIAHELMEFINENRGPVLAFFNGRELDLDHPNDVKEYFLDHGLEESKLRSIEFHEKTYAFLRDWMDGGISDRVIIKVIREMFRRREYDTRDIPKDVLLDVVGDDLTPTIEKYIEQEYPMHIPLEDRVFAKMKQFRRSFLTGGGRHECLAEIRLLMNALNIRYREVKRFIY